MGSTAADGGRIPIWTHPRPVVPQTDYAVHEIEVGEIARPVETPFGFHILQRRGLSGTPAETLSRSP